MARVVHFEIPADNPEELVKFYENVFDWKVNKWDESQPYWLVGTGENGTEGINGAITQKNEYIQQTVNTVDVNNIEETIDAVKKAGGSIMTEIMIIPGIGRFAYCKDTQGNQFGIIESDQK